MSERVAVLTTSYPRAPGDGSGHFVHSEVRRALETGHEVHVFAPGTGLGSRDGEAVHWLGDHGAFGWPGALPRLRENPARALGMVEFAWRAQRTLRRFHQDAPFAQLQAHFLVPCGWPITTAVGFGPRTQIELVGHGSDVRTFCRLPNGLRKRIAHAWLAQRVRLRVTSDELATLLRAGNPELSASLRIEASPIDVRAAPGRGAARRACGLAESAAVALVVGRLIPEKRIALALQALALVAGATVIVVGDGPELVPLATRFPNVRFTGRLTRDQTLSYIVAADVLVSASAEEGAPSVVREARALGVAVVAVAAGDLAAWAAQDPGILLARR